MEETKNDKSLAGNTQLYSIMEGKSFECNICFRCPAPQIVPCWIYHRLVKIFAQNPFCYYEGTEYIGFFNHLKCCCCFFLRGKTHVKVG